MEQEINCLLISAQFSRVLGSPPMCEWKGVNGAFSQISHVFPDLSRNLIKKVVRETWECEIRGEEYNARRKIENIMGLTL